MGEKIRKIYSVIFLFLLFVFLTQLASAQYQVYYWSDFENAIFPQEAVSFGLNLKERINVVDLNTILGMPSAFRQGIAGSETKRYGLELKATPLKAEEKTNAKFYITGLAFKVVLDRDKLGASGRALYQADFFIPQKEKKLPGLAVLAMEPFPQGVNVPQSFYRFGITKNRWAYFSYVIIDSKQANVFLFDERIIQFLPRPGWHRFSIVFEGPTNIRCYIDGNETSFSPVKEPTMRKLQVGIMLADPDDVYACYLDNPSIQWTPQDVPLPDSPYAPTWKGYKPPPSKNVIQPASGAAPLVWLEPSVGWQRSVDTNTNLLIYFHAPRIPPTLKLNSILESNSTAQDFLRKYVLIKIDVNQLEGGRYAERFGVFKVPTFVIFDPKNNKEITRAVFRQNDNYESFSAQLKLK